MGMTISDQLARHARVTPDAVALTFDGVPLTYRHLDERVSRLAGVFAERGVGAGDRVAVMAHNSPEMVEAYFACARIGAICVPLNFRLVADEVAYQLADSGAAARARGRPVRAAPPPARESTAWSSGRPTRRRCGRSRPSASRPAVDRELARGHHVHLRHHGQPQGRGAHARQPAGRTVSKLIHIGHRSGRQVLADRHAAVPHRRAGGLCTAVVFIGGQAVLGRSAAFDPAPPSICSKASGSPRASSFRRSGRRSATCPASPSATSRRCGGLVGRLAGLDDAAPPR